VDLSKLASKAKRINITLPERVLALVDEQAKREGESRSGLLARAVLDYIGRHKVA
jgi:metal-responsive CopG/Arc/MetJ family transcriptional regulator